MALIALYVHCKSWSPLVFFFNNIKTIKRPEIPVIDLQSTSFFCVCIQKGTNYAWHKLSKLFLVTFLQKITKFARIWFFRWTHSKNFHDYTKGFFLKNLFGKGFSQVHIHESEDWNFMKNLFCKGFLILKSRVWQIGKTVFRPTSQTTPNEMT